jgi:hypothetical protein
MSALKVGLHAFRIWLLLTSCLNNSSRKGAV